MVACAAHSADRCTALYYDILLLRWMRPPCLKSLASAGRNILVAALDATAVQVSPCAAEVDAFCPSGMLPQVIKLQRCDNNPCYSFFGII